MSMPVVLLCGPCDDQSNQWTTTSGEANAVYSFSDADDDNLATKELMHSCATCSFPDFWCCARPCSTLVELLDARMAASYHVFHLLLLRTSHTVVIQPAKPLSISHVTKHYLHLFSIIAAPNSSYSCREIHIWWNVPRLPKTLPPIHPPYFRSTLLELAMTRIFGLGKRACRSDCIRSGRPAMRDPAPVRMMLFIRCGLVSTSQALMAFFAADTMVCSPDGAGCDASVYAAALSKRPSATLKRSMPKTWFQPSGISKGFGGRLRT